MFTESLALHCMVRTERIWANVLFLGDKEAHKLFKCKILGCRKAWHENCQALRDQVPATAPPPWPQQGVRTQDTHPVLQLGDKPMPLTAHENGWYLKCPDFSPHTLNTGRLSWAQPPARLPSPV